MSEAARILLEILKLGRSPEALAARAEHALQRSLVLSTRAERASAAGKPKRAKRLQRRADAAADRSKALRERARRKGAA